MAVPLLLVQTGANLTALAYRNGHMGWDDGGWWVMFTVMALFWLGVLAVAAWAVATYARRDSGRRDTALDIARRRYASGEISAEEFDRLKRDLS